MAAKKRTQASALAPENEQIESVAGTENTEVATQTAQASQSEPLIKIGIYDPKGRLHRVYSRMVHGENFKELADQYVSNPKRQGWTVR